MEQPWDSKKVSLDRGSFNEANRYSREQYLRPLNVSAPLMGMSQKQVLP